MNAWCSRVCANTGQPYLFNHDPRPTRAVKMDYPCIQCAADVRPRQQAVQCDSCLRWQHRVCGTGITQEQYRRANKGIEDISWVCESCSCIVDRANSRSSIFGWPGAGSWTARLKSYVVHSTNWCPSTRSCAVMIRWSRFPSCSSSCHADKSRTTWPSSKQW